MDRIQHDFTQSALAAAVKRNLYAYFRSFRTSKQAEVLESDGLFRWHTAIRHPWFNSVLAARPADNEDDGTIQAALAYFQARGVMSFSWWLEPGLPVESWASLLYANGFHYNDQTPGMAVELAGLPETNVQPASLTITPVETLDTLQVWIQIFIQGYGIPDTFSNPLFDLLASLGLGWPNRHYLGTLDSAPVATSSLFLGAGVAGIYNVSTSPAARGQGIGTTMTLAPLNSARDLGYRVGILQSSKLGLGIYRRLGFREVCTMDHFDWEAGE